MSGVQSPQILSDLYRDLRDRRLLPLVIVLVVGLAVIPIALSSKSESTVPPPAPAAPVASKSNAPTSQVVTSDPGVRDYKRRLSGDGKDPFVQLFAVPTGAGAAAEAAAGDTGISSSGVTTGTSTAGTAGTVSGSGTTVTAGSGTTGSVPSGGSNPVTRTETTEERYILYRLETKSGASDAELETRENVEAFGSLPSMSVPALTYLGVTVDSDLNAKKAFFLVSNGVSQISGDGQCIVGDPCQLLSLEPGQSMQLIWTDGVSYTVKLSRFNEVIRKKQGGKKKSGSGKAGRRGGDRSARQLLVG